MTIKDHRVNLNEFMPKDTKIPKKLKTPKIFRQQSNIDVDRFKDDILIDFK